MSRDWSTVGYVAFGDKARKLFGFSAFVDLYGGGVVSSVILTGMNIQAFSTLPLSMLVCSVAVLLFILLFVPEKYFLKFAVLGLLCQLMMLASLVITGVELEIQGAAATANDLTLVNLAGFPAALGIAIALFNVHCVAPVVYQMMSDRTGWSRVVVLADAVVCCYRATTNAVIHGGVGCCSGSVSRCIGLAR